MKTWLWVALGSGIGGLARVMVAGLVVRILGDDFPYGILLVNLLGSFAIGVIAALTGPEGRFWVSAEQRQFWMAGVCGGFTTYSFFVLGAHQLVQADSLGKAVLYMGATLVTCMVAVWVGYLVGARGLPLYRSRERG